MGRRLGRGGCDARGLYRFTSAYFFSQRIATRAEQHRPTGLAIDKPNKPLRVRPVDIAWLTEAYLVTRRISPVLQCGKGTADYPRPSFWIGERLSLRHLENLRYTSIDPPPRPTSLSFIHSLNIYWIVSF